MNMNIQSEKLGLIEWISKLNDISIIEKLKLIKEDYLKSMDWWDTLNKEELESIERGLKDLEDGKIHSHETARKVYEKYLVTLFDSRQSPDKLKLE
ncbi:MAG TPA: hypothetical protein DDW27_04310 [Bacteroidales bacterium]|nr:hypothetical protein [Bacteroidales bacterium]